MSSHWVAFGDGPCRPLQRAESIGVAGNTPKQVEDIGFMAHRFPASRVAETLRHSGPRH